MTQRAMPIELLRGAIQLPNGDLWRGAQQAERADTVDNAPLPSTDPDEIVAQMLTTQRGEQLACTFCGSQFSRKQLNELREHVEAQHSKALDRDGELEKAALVAELEQRTKG